MIWRLRSDEPSLSSTNEKSFESRRVRTQPWTWIASIGASPCKAVLIGVGEFIVIQIDRDAPRLQQTGRTCIYIPSAFRRCGMRRLLNSTESPAVKWDHSGQSKSESSG